MLVRVSAVLVLTLSALHAQQAQPVGPGGTLAVVRSQPATVSVAPVTTAVTIDFDRPVDLSSVTTSTFRVFGRYSGPARGSYSFAHGARRVTFTPERPFSAGEVVFHEGDEGRELFLIASGSASVKLRLAGEGRLNRLATFSAGTVFGELALLDPGPRSASVEVDAELICYVLTDVAFEQLGREHPDIAIRLMANLGRELSRRLRQANQTIYQLEA